MANDIEKNNSPPLTDREGSDTAPKYDNEHLNEHQPSHDLKHHGGDEHRPSFAHSGNLVELEVDLARAIDRDAPEGDYEADTSPFAVVRSVVPEIDDPSMPVNTFRAWFLGIVSYGDQVGDHTRSLHNTTRSLSLSALELINSFLSGKSPTTTVVHTPAA